MLVFASVRAVTEPDSHQNMLSSGWEEHSQPYQVKI